MRKTIISLVVALASLVPTGVLADGMPPEASKASSGSGEAPSTRVTQSDLQADAPDQYTVVKGDTLWGLAGRFLKDPWKWPQIWNMNRDQIKDPHWIYPGDVIRLDRTGAYPQLSLASGGGVAGGTDANSAATNVVKLDPRVRIEPLTSAVTSIPGSAIGPFLSQPLVVETEGMNNAPTILAIEESRVVVSTGESFYADRIGANDALNWQVYRPGQPLRDPETAELLGYEAKYVGDARVRRFGNPTTLDVTRSREEVIRGDRLAPARETSYPNYIPHAPGKLVRGVIMSVDGGVAEVGQYQVITINRGARDGIELGHVLASYRRGGVLNSRGHIVPATENYGGAGGGGHSGWFDWLPRWGTKTDTAQPSIDTAPANSSEFRIPDERNGLVFVFRVFDKMSYALVMRSSRPIYVGDIVQTP